MNELKIKICPDCGEPISPPIEIYCTFCGRKNLEEK